MLKFFDAHTHANLAEFKDDYKEVIGRALAAGVGLVNVGTDINDSRRALEIAREFEKEPVYAAVGFHPEYAADRYFNYEAFKKLALDQKTVAIGECGLDYYREISDKKQETRGKQKAVFIEQIKLAHEVQKPLMVHCREAFNDLINILVSCRTSLVADNPGIIHFFSGTKDEAQKLIDLGFSFTFGGVITFARDHDEVIKSMPLDRILSETDAPFVAPVPYRGKRNEPAYVVKTVKKLAEIKNVSVDEMAVRTLENARRVFAAS